MNNRETISTTIRLPKELVQWIDAQVDGVVFRNRTHVIEKALFDFKNRKK